MSTTSTNNNKLCMQVRVCSNNSNPTILNHSNHCVGKYLPNYSLHYTKHQALHLIKIKLYTLASTMEFILCTYVCMYLKAIKMPHLNFIWGFLRNSLILSRSRSVSPFFLRIIVVSLLSICIVNCVSAYFCARTHTYLVIVISQFCWYYVTWCVQKHNPIVCYYKHHHRR